MGGNTQGWVRPTLLVVMLAGMALCPIQCKWPWEYINPDERVPAPAPPVITEPRADTTIWYAITATATFNWIAVTGASTYSLEIDSTSQFSSGESNPYRIVRTVPSSPVVVSFPRALVQKYFYRIRGLSQGWKEGMTEWSSTRWLTMRLQREPGQ